MKCESCTINEVEVEERYDEEQQPYYLCRSCKRRLINKALRPLEFFNLAAIHGHFYYLHYDFYDFDTGEATQPHINVYEADKFPFPNFDEVKDNPERLIDFAFVQYHTKDYVLAQLKKFPKEEVLQLIDKKISYNRAIHYKAYEIIAKVVGRLAESWMKEEWTKRKPNEVAIYAEAIASCLERDEAFTLLIPEIEKSSGNQLANDALALLFFQHEKTLDWIERIAEKIATVPDQWGVLAATSQFSWQRADKWVKAGRPLSLIALDALWYCTIKEPGPNQPVWLQQHPPKLTDEPRPEIVAVALTDYVMKDNVPRTRNAVESIIMNVFEV